MVKATPAKTKRKRGHKHEFVRRWRRLSSTWQDAVVGLLAGLTRRKE